MVEQGEEKLKEHVSEMASDLVKKEVKEYTKGAFSELTDIIIEAATEKAVDEGLVKIKEKFNPKS